MRGGAVNGARGRVAQLRGGVVNGVYHRVAQLPSKTASIGDPNSSYVIVTSFGHGAAQLAARLGGAAQALLGAARARAARCAP